MAETAPIDPSRRLYLADHVYLCVTDGHAVLLDLKRDKYIGVGRAQMATLAECIEGWPRAAPDRPFEGPDCGARLEATDGRTTGKGDAGRRLLTTMLSTGMLTPDASRGKTAGTVEVEYPQAALVHDDLDSRPAVRAAHVLHSICAASRAAIALRCTPIAEVAASVRRRKTDRGRPGRSLDTAAARELVAAFVHLRPLFFGARDRCLFDSLTLLEYLAAWDIYPSWIFGVRTVPFAAHCWVQHEGIVFNDTPERVRSFAPILAI